MINLLPSSTRSNMHYARRNSLLVHWTIILVLALLGVGLIVASGILYLTQATNSYNDRTESSRVSLKSQNIDETQKQVDDISNNVKLVTQVLSREILFSKLLKQLGSALPENTSLAQLQITDVTGGLTLSALAKNIDSATQIQVNLQDPTNKIFDKADIETINCDTATDTKSPYPCVVQIRALFAKNNPFSYISPSSPGVKK